jgi:hypothetical protein
MAATSQGARLTEAHRLEQQRVRDDFLAEFIALWVLLDSARLDETGPGWVSAVMRVIRAFRLRSAQVASRYFLEFQAAEAPVTVPRPRIDAPRLELPASGGRDASALPRPRPSEPRRPAQNRPAPEIPRAPRERRVRFDFDESLFQRDDRPRARVDLEIPDIDWGPSDRAAEVSLIVTGPVGQKSKAKRGKPADRARDESFVQASGAASRHVLTGGRRSLLTLLQDDPQALGWARVTDGDPCAFCAMLASRGPVYGTEASAKFEAHDACACTAEPVYSRDAPWPGRAVEFQELWHYATQGYSGKDAINAFRRLYEQQQRDARRAVA